jgi:hypothetical protein
VPLPFVQLASAEKLHLLRGLDQFRRWDSVDDQRQCLQCGKVIRGRDLDVVGGTRESGPMRLQCPTRDCRALPIDWVVPGRVLGRAEMQAHQPGRNDDSGRVAAVVPKSGAAILGGAKGAKVVNRKLLGRLLKRLGARR